jgi:hypothetical protein
LNYENTIFPANFRVVDLLQYKDLLKIHHAFHHTLRRGTEGHGGSIAIKGVVENSPCFADPPKSQCFDDVLLRWNHRPARRCAQAIADGVIEGYSLTVEAQKQQLRRRKAVAVRQQSQFRSDFSAAGQQLCSVEMQSENERSGWPVLESEGRPSAGRTFRRMGDG